MIKLDAANPRGIVWIASYPKSGNTWVRAFLHTLLLILQGKEVDEVDLDGVAYFGQNERLVPYYLRHLSDPAAIADRATVARLRPQIQSDIALGSPGPVIIKTHNALIDYLGAPLVNRAVSAGGVYVVRNPLDVAISLADFRGISIDVAIGDLQTAGYSTETNDEDVYFVTGSWSEHVASWTSRPSGAIMVIRYEDMLATPGETFTKLARHLQMPGTPEQIARAVDLTSFARMQEAEAARGFLEKPPLAGKFFRVGRAGQWNGLLTQDQVDRVVTAHGGQMARFGYIPG